MGMREIRVMVVDDSAPFRRAVKTVVEAVPGFRVCGEAAGGREALEALGLRRPDLVLLDQEMAGGAGLETLDGIQDWNRRPGQTPIAVIMLSAHTKKGTAVTVKALERGAFDFIPKPEPGAGEGGLSALERRLVPKLNHFASLKSLERAEIPAPPRIVPSPLVDVTALSRPHPPETPESAGFPLSAIAIGISTGGPKALSLLLPPLCARTSLPILLVQHMPPRFTAALAESLAPKCGHRVKEAEDGEKVTERTVYIAPGGRHMEVKGRRAEARIVLHDGPPENGCRPSADTLFRSLPAVYGSGLAVLVLTGMGHDGSRTLPDLRRAGCHILAQDEATSVVWGMPGSAVATGMVHEVAPLGELPERIALLSARRLQRPGGNLSESPSKEESR